MLELVILGCTCGVAFSLRLPLLRLGHRLRLLALGVLAAALLTGCTRVVVWVLSGAAERCLLSLLLLGVGLAVVEPLAGVCFCASSYSSCGFQRRVLPQVTLSGFCYLFWLLLPVLLLRRSSVCWVCGVLGKALGFHLVPCSSSGACGLVQLPLPQITLRGFCLF